MRTDTLRLVRSALAILLAIAGTAYGGIPPMEVIVSDAGGKVAFKGAMSANATFSTGNLQPGNYVVQFKTKSAAAKDSQYLLVVSAGRKKVIADSVPGAKFTGGGVAMKVEVGQGLNIAGQIASDDGMAQQGRSKYRIIGGQRFVWVTAELGSSLGGHWVAEGLPPAANVTYWRTEDIQKKQDRGGEGSMILYSHHHPEPPGG